jgi:hypothetical protein
LTVWHEFHRLHFPRSENVTNKGGKGNAANEPIERCISDVGPNVLVWTGLSDATCHCRYCLGNWYRRYSPDAFPLMPEFSLTCGLRVPHRQ